VNIPVCGRLESVIGRNELVATRDCATIYPPDTPTCIRRWSKSCSIVGVRFERDYLGRCRGYWPSPHAGCPTTWT
jgi:hypothetical protein